MRMVLCIKVLMLGRTHRVSVVTRLFGTQQPGYQTTLWGGTMRVTIRYRFNLVIDVEA